GECGGGGEGGGWGRSRQGEGLVAGSADVLPAESVAASPRELGVEHRAARGEIQCGARGVLREGQRRAGRERPDLERRVGGGEGPDRVRGPGWFRFVALLRPRLLPVKVMAPFVMVVKRLTYCACAVATRSSSVTTTTAVTRRRPGRSVSSTSPSASGTMGRFACRSCPGLFGGSTFNCRPRPDL